MSAFTAALIGFIAGPFLALLLRELYYQGEYFRLCAKELRKHDKNGGER